PAGARMTTAALVILLASFSAAPQAAETACWYSSPENRVPTISRTVRDGIVVTMTRRSGPDAVEDPGLVEGRGRAGAVALSKSGFNTRLHPDSGRDVDNDGSPDLIVGVDEGGGNRCCWEYSVLSLRPAPHVIASFDNAALESDAAGRTVIWNTVPF